MSITLAGMYVQPHLLRLMLSQSARWQSLVGAASAAASREFIDIFERRETEKTPSLNRALILLGMDWRRSYGQTGAFRTDATLEMTIELEIPESAGAETIEDEHNWFLNQLGQIMEEVEAVVLSRAAIEGTNPLNIIRHRIAIGPERITYEERQIDDPEHSRTPLRAAWFATVLVEVL